MARTSANARANATALTLAAAALFPLAASALDCRFTLADQSDWAAKKGFYLDLENTAAGASKFCKVRTMTVAVGVANGSQWRFIVANPRWRLDHDYIAKVVIAPARFELYLDGRRLGHMAGAFAGLPNRELQGNSAPSWAAGPANYVLTQTALSAASSGGPEISETFGVPARPVPLMLFAPASNSRGVPFEYSSGASLTVTATFRLTAASADLKSYAPFVDAYGQSTYASFPEKIGTDAGLRSAAEEEPAKLAGWGVPAGYDAWGGLLTGPLIGGNNTPVTGREWEFAALPPRTAPFDSAWSSGDWGNTGIASVSFDTWNMIRKYGTGSWRAEATKLAVQRLKAWGFSGFGKWSSDAGSLPILPVLEARQVPLLARHADIFDPKVQALFQASLRQQMQERVNDPLILGWSYGSEYAQIVTPDEVSIILRMAGSVPAKRALVDHARSAIYGNRDAAMAAAWGLGADLYNGQPTPPAADIETLRQFYADRYYGFIYQTVKSIDPNHLYFGSWIVPGWWVNAADWKLIAAHVDVIGYDRYAPMFEDSLLRSLAQSTGKPIFLGEFSFPPSYNLLRGYQAYPSVSAADDADAGAQYGKALAAAARNPWCVGVAWFEYRDQPVSGRGFPGETHPQLVEGENYAFGLVDVADRPKYALVEQVRTANRAAAGLR